jgi:hypothetical protein
LIKTSSNRQILGVERNIPSRFPLNGWFTNLFPANPGIISRSGDRFKGRWEKMGRDRNKWEDMEEMTRGYVMVYRYTVLQSNGHMMHMHVAYIYIETIKQHRPVDTKTHCKPKVRTSPCNPIALSSRFPDSYALVVLAVLLYNDK